MISQPQVEPLKYAGALTMFSQPVICPEAPAQPYIHASSVSHQEQSWRGNPAELGHTPKGYLFLNKSRFTVQGSQAIPVPASFSGFGAI